MQMPPVEKAILARRQDLLRELSVFLHKDQVIVDENALRAYDTDA